MQIHRSLFERTIHFFKLKFIIHEDDLKNTV